MLNLLGTINSGRGHYLNISILLIRMILSKANLKSEIQFLNFQRYAENFECKSE